MKRWRDVCGYSPVLGFSMPEEKSSLTLAVQQWGLCCPRDAHCATCKAFVIVVRTSCLLLWADLSHSGVTTISWHGFLSWLPGGSGGSLTTYIAKELQHQSSAHGTKYFNTEMLCLTQWPYIHQFHRHLLDWMQKEYLCVWEQVGGDLITNQL